MATGPSDASARIGRPGASSSVKKAQQYFSGFFPRPPKIAVREWGRWKNKKKVQSGVQYTQGRGKWGRKRETTRWMKKSGKANEEKGYKQPGTIIILLVHRWFPRCLNFILLPPSFQFSIQKNHWTLCAIFLWKFIQDLWLLHDIIRKHIAQAVIIDWFSGGGDLPAKSGGRKHVL
jgi:hypothetical protein